MPSTPYGVEALRTNSAPSTVVGSEADRACTDDTALDGLAAIENLALLGDRMSV
ncbi:hypothetical protein [Streptomyces sp. NPDC005181]|uniref:hypothetical protein n=1 Tax=Streptomyces sp. NPDC005181 TaxID=3156869 RepID=UPI0033AA0715